MTTWYHHGQMGFNGNVTTNQGYRQIVLEPSGAVSPVLFAIRSGHLPNRTTCQTVQKGYLIIHVTTWSHNSPARITLHEVMDVRNDCFEMMLLREEMVARTSIRDMLKEVFLETKIRRCNQKEEVINFLCGVTEGRASSLLPDGLGWQNDMSLGDVGKFMRFDKFFKELLDDGAVKPEYLESIKKTFLKVTPSKALNYEWNAALPMDQFFSVMDNCKSLNTCFVYKGGKWQCLVVLSSELVLDDIQKAIVVEYSCFKNMNNKLYGMRITLLSKEK